MVHNFRKELEQTTSGEDLDFEEALNEEEINFIFEEENEEEKARATKDIKNKKETTFAIKVLSPC